MFWRFKKALSFLPTKCRETMAGWLKSFRLSTRSYVMGSPVQSRVPATKRKLAFGSCHILGAFWPATFAPLLVPLRSLNRLLTRYHYQVISGTWQNKASVITSLHSF